MTRHRHTLMSTDSNTVTISPQVCTVCGKGHNSMTLDRESYAKWIGGTFIQIAFPRMSAADREVLITGTHDECFNKLFPPDDEE